MCYSNSQGTFFPPAFVCARVHTRVCENRAHDAQPVCAKCDLGVK